MTNEQPSSLVHRAGALFRSNPGLAAQCRREDPMRPGTGIWKTLALLDHIDSRSDKDHRSHTTLVVAVAILGDLHMSSQSVGTALRKADVSEQRLNRLLLADDDALYPVVLQLTRTLRAKNTPVDLVQFEHLLTARTDEFAENTRRHIAADYFKAERSKSSSP